MKSPVHFFSFCFLLFLLIGGTALSQKIIFNKVYPSEGKTFTYVTGITQDLEGYMWFASKKGLYKYDGYHITVYKNNSLNSNSLVNNTLESICVDSTGIIWIGSLGAGLDRLDPSTGNFTHFHHNSKEPSSLANDTVASLLCDHDGVLWVGTHGGLDRFDPGTNKFTHYRYNPNDPTSISNNKVRSLYEDRERTLWVGTGSPFAADGGATEEGGLNRFDKKSGKFIRYLHDSKDPHSLISNKVRAIFEDKKGTLWVGTGGDGLHTMDKASGNFKQHLYDSSHPEEISLSPRRKVLSTYSHITFITEDAAEGMWIGTIDAGLDYYDPKKHQLKHYESNTDSTGEFSGRDAWCAYTSRDGVLWISNMKGDLYRIDPFQKKLPHYELPSGGPVSSFYQEPDGTLWIGGIHGLTRYDPGKKTTKQFTNDPLNPATISSNVVLSINADRQGRIWIGTDGSGLNLFNKDKEIFTRYVHDPKNNGSINADLIVPVYEDQHQNLWIGTYKGLDLMNQKTGLFTHHLIKQNDSSRFGSNLVTCVLEDRHGKFWVGVWGQSGIFELNKETGKFENFLTSISITGIYEDSDGILWVGADDGLYQFNQSSRTFSRFTDPSSLKGIPDVISIEEDDKKNLWLGTTNGIIKLNPRRNETNTFDESYGVRENVLNLTAAYKTRNGELYFGDTTGYFAFFPDQLTKNLSAPQIILTSFSISNKSIQPGNAAPYDGQLWKTTQIKLNHNQNIFSFDFVSIDYSNPEANRSIYMLENYDDEWRIADKNGRAYYFNVPPGKYVFKIKSSNSYGIWTQKDIEIIITPPWWRRWWAYLVIAILFICIIWGIIYYRSRSLIREKHYLEEKVKSRTVEIVKQKEEISKQRDNLKQALDELKSTQSQLIQSEKMASLGELTAGIAHEIQNPLNFVNNFSEVNAELIDEMQGEIEKGNIEEAKNIANDIKENEQKINHHGKRADAIVKGMLQHSRSSSGVKEPTDINDLADEYLRLSYHGLRARDKTFNANMVTDFDQTLEKIKIIPQDVGRVILNLFTNAFYSVNEKKKNRMTGSKEYEPTVTVSTKSVKLPGDEGLGVFISVKDNGMGIPQKVVDKIFQPFFTTKPTGQGTGLGLSISYDIIKSHGGEMKLETKEGEFAEFMIILPYH